MAYTHSTQHKHYDGNGSTDEFSFPYLFYADEDFTVTVTDAAHDPTLFVLGVDYAVSGEGDPDGGTITTDVPVPSGSRITISREVDFNQIQTLISAGSLHYLEDIELSLDDIVFMIQHLKALIDQTVGRTIPDTRAVPTVEDLLGAVYGIHGNMTGLDEDDHTQYSLISSQAGVPSSTPTRVGEINIDTTADQAYIAVGTASSADWRSSTRKVRYLNFNLVERETDVEADTNLYGDYTFPYGGAFLQSDSSPELFMASNTTAGITGTMVVDCHLNGTTIMTTNKLDIETTEKTTETAATQPDLTTATFSAGDIFTIDTDAIHSGTAAKGLQVNIAVLEDN